MTKRTFLLLDAVVLDVAAVVAIVAGHLAVGLALLLLAAGALAGFAVARHGDRPAAAR